MLNSRELIVKVRPLSIDSIEDVGDILQYVLPWAGLLAIALVGDRQGAWEWLYAGLTTTVVTLLLKYIFNFTPLGKRPNGADYSFPSGHTSSAFMGACYIHFTFGLGWAIVPYLLAGFTGYSRIWAKKHYLRDVIAGAVLSFAVCYYFIIVR